MRVRPETVRPANFWQISDRGDFSMERWDGGRGEIAPSIIPWDPPASYLATLPSCTKFRWDSPAGPAAGGTSMRMHMHHQTARLHSLARAQTDPSTSTTVSTLHPRVRTAQHEGRIAAERVYRTSTWRDGGNFAPRVGGTSCALQVETLRAGVIKVSEIRPRSNCARCGLARWRDVCALTLHTNPRADGDERSQRSGDDERDRQEESA